MTGLSCSTILIWIKSELIVASAEFAQMLYKLFSGSLREDSSCALCSGTQHALSCLLMVVFSIRERATSATLHLIGTGNMLLEMRQ